MEQDYVGHHQDEKMENLFYEQKKTELRLYEKDVENNLEIQKKYACTKILDESSIQRTREYADVVAKKELQRTFISLTDGGEIILQRERFGADIKGKLPIKLLAGKLYSHTNDVEASALVVVLRTINDKECSLFWNLKNITPRSIRRPFEKNGISFGFGEKKESEVRKKLVMTIMNIAKTEVLPERHGWYKMNRKWRYAFPEELTWQEVEKCF